METAAEAMRRIAPAAWEWTETADLFEPSAKVGRSSKRPSSPVILDGEAEWETLLEGDQGEVMVFEEPIDRPDLVAQQA